jgi:hypothetical protein
MRGGGWFGVCGGGSWVGRFLDGMIPSYGKEMYWKRGMGGNLDGWRYGS